MRVASDWLVNWSARAPFHQIGKNNRRKQSAKRCKRDLFQKTTRLVRDPSRGYLSPKSKIAVRRSDFPLLLVFLFAFRYLLVPLDKELGQKIDLRDVGSQGKRGKSINKTSLVFCIQRGLLRTKCVPQKTNEYPRTPFVLHRLRHVPGWPGTIFCTMCISKI